MTKQHITVLLNNIITIIGFPVRFLYVTILFSITDIFIHKKQKTSRLERWAQGCAFWHRLFEDRSTCFYGNRQTTAVAGHCVKQIPRAVCAIPVMRVCSCSFHVQFCGLWRKRGPSEGFFYCICGKRWGTKSVFTVAAETGCFLNCIFLFKIWKRVAVCEDNFRPSVHRWLPATGRKQRPIYANIHGGSSLSLSTSTAHSPQSSVCCIC